MSHQNKQIDHAIDKIVGCSLKTDFRDPLQNTTHTQIIECGEVNLVPTWSFLPYCGTGSYFDCYQNGKKITKRYANHLIYKGILPAIYAKAVEVQKLKK